VKWPKRRDEVSRGGPGSKLSGRTKGGELWCIRGGWGEMDHNAPDIKAPLGLGLYGAKMTYIVGSVLKLWVHVEPWVCSKKPEISNKFKEINTVHKKTRDGSIFFSRAFISVENRAKHENRRYHFFSWRMIRCDEIEG